jgi:ferredoxin
MATLDAMPRVGETDGLMAMRIVINRDTCESNGLCAGLAPALFELGDDDVLVQLQDTVSGDAIDLAKRAAKLCPKQAITIEE